MRADGFCHVAFPALSVAVRTLPREGVPAVLWKAVAFTVPATSSAVDGVDVQMPSFPET